MKKLLIEKLPRILKNKKRLETRLKVKLTNRGNEIYIEGKPEDEYIAEKVIEAIDLGFPYSVAMLIKEEDCTFEIMNIKEFTNRKDLQKVRARIIGKKGKALKILSKLSDCHFELKDNSLGIIGDPECMKKTRESVISLIGGAKHRNIYARLEKNKTLPIHDLGLKE
jgi:KH domain-containing protein